MYMYVYVRVYAASTCICTCFWHSLTLFNVLMKTLFRCFFVALQVQYSCLCASPTPFPVCGYVKPNVHYNKDMAFICMKVVVYHRFTHAGKILLMKGTAHGKKLFGSKTKVNTCSKKKSVLCSKQCQHNVEEPNSDPELIPLIVLFKSLTGH